MIRAFFNMFRNYANFFGMTSRKHYWQAIILHCLFLFLPFIPLAITASSDDKGISNYAVYILTFMIIYRILAFIPVWAITVRRLHDIPKSGWFLLLVVLPVIGGIIVLINLFKKGKGLEAKEKYFAQSPRLREIYQHPCNGGWIWLPVLLIAAGGFLFWKNESFRSTYLTNAQVVIRNVTDAGTSLKALGLPEINFKAGIEKQAEPSSSQPSITTESLNAEPDQDIPEVSPDFILTGKEEAALSIDTSTETAQAATVLKDFIPGDRIRSNKDDAVIVFIPASEFQIGSETGDSEVNKARSVTLEEYWIDRTEVTNEQYQSCVADGFCSEPEIQRSSTIADYYTDTDYAAFPVINVSFIQADTYCQWAGRRLPSDAEWENAAKNENADPFPWGRTFTGNKLNSTESGNRDTITVGSYPNGKSRFSVLDMSGNVWEWINTKAIRGGGWNSYDTTVQVTSELEVSADYIANNLGFRCALSNTDFDMSAYSELPTEELAEDLESPPNIGSERERDIDGMIEMYIPAGEFSMGIPEGKIDEKPAHIVYVDAYWMDKTEVSNSQYASCVDAGFCSEPVSIKSLKRSDYYINEDYVDYPVINITWQQAVDYCIWAGGRLPTEAEWEKAAKGPDGFLYPWGDELIEANLNYSGSGINDPKPVTDYADGASGYGILNLSGNVAEWVSDRYAENWYSVAAPAENPTGPETGAFRILRGGSWQTAQYTIQTVNRYPSAPDRAGLDRGFRCIRPE